MPAVPNLQQVPILRFNLYLPGPSGSSIGASYVIPTRPKNPPSLSHIVRRAFCLSGRTEHLTLTIPPPQSTLTGNSHPCRTHESNKRPRPSLKKREEKRENRFEDAALISCGEAGAPPNLPDRGLPASA